MYCYNIYGKLVKVNIELPLLDRITSCSKNDIDVYVEYETLNGDDTYIREVDGSYVIKLGNLAHYKIDFRNNIVVCKAPNYESFFSTFFNIPFSVYFLCKDEILYHACSLVYDHQIICLTGNKGVGKSTLMSLLANTNEFEIFGDDTIYIDNKCFGYCAHNLIKQTNETVRILNIHTLKDKNIAGKFYSIFNETIFSDEIKRIIHISRTNEKVFRLEKVTSELRKNNILRANIVGISHMPHELMVKALKTKHKINTKFYELFVPNDLEYLIKNVQEIKGKLLDTFDDKVV